MLSRSRNPLLTFLLSYHVWVTLKIQVDFRFERYWWFCLINFWNFHTIHVFEVRESIADILQSYHVWVTSKIQVDFRFNRYSEVLVIVSCRFLKFLHYSCFSGQGILCWHSYCATMFGGPRIYSVQTPRFFEVTQTFFCWLKKCSKFICSRPKVAGQSHDQRFIANWRFYTQLIQIRITVFVGCPEGCRYHTTSAVYNLVSVYNWHTHSKRSKRRLNFERSVQVHRKK